MITAQTHMADRPPRCVPAEAMSSFAAVSHHLDLGRL
jgi:hypothetical protein